MNNDDFFSMVESSGREELEDLVSDLIEVFASNISRENLDKEDYSAQVWNKDGGVTTRVLRGRWLAEYLRPIPLDEVDEVEHLKTYLQKERDFNIGNTEIFNLIIDALGEVGEDINDWKNKVPEIVSKLEYDINGQSKIRTRTLLGGLFVENDIKIEDGVWLRAPTDNEILYKGRASIGDGLSSILLHSPALLELEVSAGEEAFNERSVLKRKELVGIMKLYGRANVSEISTFREPITYSGMTGYSENMENRARNPSYNFNPIEVKRFQNLWNLLEEYTESRGSQYSYPIGIAMNHYDESLNKRTSTLSSISFSIIGLESLYRRGTKGSSTSKDIARFCGIVLSEVVDSWDAVEIKETIEEAYQFRNSWAHGDRHSDNNQSQVQRRLWDYLRASIVVFAWLDSRGILDENRLELERSMIDLSQRRELEATLGNLSIIDYLPIR